MASEDTQRGRAQAGLAPLAVGIIMVLFFIGTVLWVLPL